MQISSGWAKGMPILAPQGLATRPTGAKVRAATFNMLAPYLEGAWFLDLFAGSGGMGLEAISRGARGSVFVDASAEATRTLTRNVVELKRRAAAQSLAEPTIEIVSGRAAESLANLRRLAPFDLIFLDPPYRLVAEIAASLLPALVEIAGPDSILVIESHANELGLAASPKGWEMVKQKSYGETMVSLFSLALGPAP